MAKIGINAGTSLEELDMLGRTPQFVAHEYKYLEIEQVNLYNLKIKRC